EKGTQCNLGRNHERFSDFLFQQAPKIRAGRATFYGRIVVVTTDSFKDSVQLWVRGRATFAQKSSELQQHESQIQNLILFCIIHC
ncbi:hypothetical protein JWG44_16630, partial [Leptospira sp. 201903071]|uniref:hypothetical protein n=1 Tax=Leptospira ainazelensis TaxID=2810034 RepID=UPI0019648E87